MKSQGLSAGTSQDYAWAFKQLLQQQGVVERGTHKMQSLTSIARSKIDTFVRLPQYLRAGQPSTTAGVATKEIPVDARTEASDKLVEALVQAAVSRTSAREAIEQLGKRPSKQPLSDASIGGDRDSSEDANSTETATAFETAPGLTRQEDLEVWDYVCAALWPSDSESGSEDDDNEKEEEISGA